MKLTIESIYNDVLKGINKEKNNLSISDFDRLSKNAEKEVKKNLKGKKSS